MIRKKNKVTRMKRGKSKEREIESNNLLSVLLRCGTRPNEWGHPTRLKITLRRETESRTKSARRKDAN